MIIPKEMLVDLEIIRDKISSLRQPLILDWKEPEIAMIEEELYLAQDKIENAIRHVVNNKDQV